MCVRVEFQCELIQFISPPVRQQPRSNPSKDTFRNREHEKTEPKRNGSSTSGHRHHQSDTRRQPSTALPPPTQPTRPVRADSYSLSPGRTFKKSEIKRKRSVSLSSSSVSDGDDVQHASHSDEDGSCSCDDHSSMQSDSGSEARSYSLHSNSRMLSRIFFRYSPSRLTSILFASMYSHSDQRNTCPKTQTQRRFQKQAKKT